VPLEYQRRSPMQLKDSSLQSPHVLYLALSLHHFPPDLLFLDIRQLVFLLFVTQRLCSSCSPTHTGKLPQSPIGSQFSAWGRPVPSMGTKPPRKHQAEIASGRPNLGLSTYPVANCEDYTRHRRWCSRLSSFPALLENLHHMDLLGTLCISQSSMDPTFLVRKSYLLSAADKEDVRGCSM